MLNFQDCLALCELTEEEVLAIAEHEHLPETVALELGHYLLHTTEGVPHIKAIIRDDLAEAIAAHDLKRVLRLKLTLRHFCATHPDVRPCQSRLAG
jgi:hypothetical protein